jgi:hypothetical protein
MMKSRGHEMGRECGTVRRRMNIGFWWEDQKEIDHYKDLDVDRMILKWISQK